MSFKSLSFSLPVVITKQGNRFVAYSPVLDLSSSGKTTIEVKKNFEIATNLFLEEIIEKGTADEVLAGLGWVKKRKEWNPPQFVSSKTLDFIIPVTA